jgi:hypothetical protein
MWRLTKSVCAGIAALGLVALAYALWFLPENMSAFAAVGWGGYREFTVDRWRMGSISLVIFAIAFVWQYRRSP